MNRLSDRTRTLGDAPAAVAAQFARRAFLEATIKYHAAVTDGKQLKPLPCPPAGTIIGDARTAFLARARANGADRKRMAEQPVIGVVRALAAKYPCK